MAAFDTVDLIATKRDGGVLPADAIRYLVDGYTDGRIPDYQMSALLMAVYFRGLSEGEMLALTDAMLHSGASLDLASVAGVKVDKHSTGGVGDKVSLILAPLVAACGVPVPMMSGRGLGHTGGTVDKLESIPGFRTELEPDDAIAQLRRIGVAMISQSRRIAPADRLLYALRDVTATVESIPLIASSIMSKKLAEGVDALVFDVKVGSGAFMRERAEARHLAEALVRIARRADKEAVAWLTGMDQPLGRTIGNWPEVAEAIACLRGAQVDDLADVTITLAAEMLVLGGAASTVDDARARALDAISTGQAWQKFLHLVEAQGGDLASVEDPDRRTASAVEDLLLAPPNAEGFVARIDARMVGLAAVHLGAGRARKEDAVDPLAGIRLEHVAGDVIEPGTPLARIYTTRARDLSDLKARLLTAFRFAPDPPAKQSVLLERLKG